MPRIASLPIKQLQLDLRNFRTVPQANEEEAVDAMVSIRPGWFWPLMESLLDSELPADREHSRAGRRGCRRENRPSRSRKGTVA